MSRPRRTVDEQFMSLTRQDGDCLVWTAATTRKGGYGVFTPYFDGKPQGTRLAHRWAYEQQVGPVPDGLVLDHLCRVRHCVNVAHLEAVTQRTNVHRGLRVIRSAA